MTAGSNLASWNAWVSFKRFTQRNRFHKGSRLTFAGGATLVTTGSFSLSFSVTFRFLFWGSAELDEFATISNLRLFLSKGVPGRGCAGPSSINCWLLSGMNTRKSALRSGASLKSFAIWRETSSCSSAYVSDGSKDKKGRKRHLINGVGLVVITGENVQKLSIRIRITALFDFLDVLDSRFNGLSIDTIRPGVGRRHRFYGWGYSL